MTGRELQAGRTTQRRQRLAGLSVPGAVPEREIATLDRIIAWQIRTAGWHLGEARRLRGQAGRVNGTDDPPAASAPGQAINAETARQPGGRGQTGGA